MIYFVFELPGFEPENASWLFRGVAATVEAAKVFADTHQLTRAEIVSFDGVRLAHVCERPYWKRHIPPQVPMGRMVADWGMSDQFA